MEHRCGYRRVANTTITLRTRSGVAAEGHLCNISASGALVRSPLPIQLHGEVLVQFGAKQPPGRTERPVAAGQVVRHVAEGFALEWTEFSPEAVRSFLRQLGNNFSAPAHRRHAAK